MALTPLTHRRLATVTAAGTATSQVLDAIWTGVAPTVTTYSDGSTRSFSGASATGWTWTLVQVLGVTEAVYATPPGGSLAQRIIIAGRSAAPTPSPTMLSPDTFTASGLMMAHALNAGAFTTWNAASPFTSGYFSGYMRLGGATTGFTAPVAVTIYESQEDITVQILVGGTAALFMGCGAIVDPAPAAANAESDGRRYGLWSIGNTAVSGMLTNASSGTIFIHSAVNGNTHMYVKRPGLSTTETARRLWNSNTATVAEMTTLGSELPGATIDIAASSGWAGRLREKTWVRPMLFGQTITNGGTIKGYGLAPLTTANGDTVLLEY